jgi:hypothetical protein
LQTACIREPVFGSAGASDRVRESSGRPVSGYKVIFHGNELVNTNVSSIG